MARRYAQGTTVSVESSRGEITGILAKHGCNRMAWATEPEGDTLQFELGGQQYRFQIRRPSLEDAKTAYLATGKTVWGWNHQADQQRALDAEWRRRWRAHVLLLKAKLEFADGGDTTLEREFMPNLVIEGGRRTLAEWLSDEKGGQPLLAAGGK
jgi:hypothetical protein